MKEVRLSLTIAALYKNRRQVELLFKWIKQHLRIEKFHSTKTPLNKAFLDTAEISGQDASCNQLNLL